MPVTGYLDPIAMRLRLSKQQIMAMQRLYDEGRELRSNLYAHGKSNGSRILNPLIKLLLIEDAYQGKKFHARLIQITSIGMAAVQRWREYDGTVPAAWPCDGLEG